MRPRFGSYWLGVQLVNQDGPEMIWGESLDQHRTFQMNTELVTVISYSYLIQLLSMKDSYYPYFTRLPTADGLYYQF